MRDISTACGAGEFVSADVLRLMVGEPIARGCSREVYALPGRPDAVLKLETDAGSYHNILEWELWREVQDGPWAKYFAECIAISPSGTGLIMARTAPVAEIPASRPKWLQDVKPDNFGSLPDGRVVCHDYSITWLIRANLSKMKTVRTTPNPPHKGSAA
jgi:hypothetical protein